MIGEPMALTLTVWDAVINITIPADLLSELDTIVPELREDVQIRIEGLMTSLLHNLVAGFVAGSFLDEVLTSLQLHLNSSAAEMIALMQAERHHRRAALN